MYRFATILLLAFTLTSTLASGQNRTEPSAVQLAKKYPIVVDKPAARFFEGALLGNGGMGVVVTTRPDAVVLYFGHNNVWDIRLAENHKEELKTFDYVFNKVKAIPSNYGNLTDDPWYAAYNRMSGDNYSKPYPRPFPCGSVLLGFDRRKVQVLGHTLDISNGLCIVRLLTAERKILSLKLYTDMHSDRLLMQLTDTTGKATANIFDRIKVMPDPSTPGDIPHYTAQEDMTGGVLSFRQVLPRKEPLQLKAGEEDPGDKAFRLTVKLNTALSKKTRLNWSGNTENMAEMEAALNSSNNFIASVSLEEGLNSSVSKAVLPINAPTAQTFTDVFASNQTSWNKYWSKSGVKLGDKFLEEIWYHNLYFFNCAVKEGVTCPGLFANWSYDRIGTAWHGDYHMNYNTQQAFWATFSSNHLDKNLPYVDLIEKLMPVSRQWAKDYYGLPGAYFPHSAFPVEMTMNPYPVPDWGWEVCETPWAVQGLWWQYLYSGDVNFLKDRAYEPIKAAVQFLTAYMKRPDAHGGSRWTDSNYHVFPSVPPELYGLRPGFKNNYDCTTDLALIKFIFNAFKKATTIVGTTAVEKGLLADVDGILTHFPSYPTAASQEHGEVLVAVPGEHDQVVYNVPDALFSVFPGEDHGLHSDLHTFKLLKDTYLNQQNEGGNDLVFGNLQAARIGMLDLEAFKRQVRYSLLPNGTATDMVMQTRGRYNDQSDFTYMAGMGIWLENFALPAVINECLMQSYDGTIRLFPNWPKRKDAQFSTLRAAGAFLVSAEQRDGNVTYIRILSEKGNDLHLLSPWGSKGSFFKGKKKMVISGEEIVLKTKPGEEIFLRAYQSAI